MKSTFEEIGEYMEKETNMRELLKDTENVSIALMILEEQGWECR